jgi:hypothetical protein
MNQTYQGSLPDNYSLNWIGLPQNTRFQVILKNSSSGGRFRASVACDTGTGLVIFPFTSVVDGGGTAFVRSYDPAACPGPVAVVTNITQTEAKPSFSGFRGYTLSITPPAEPTKISVNGRVSGARVIATGKLKPANGRPKVEVALFELDGGWKEVKSRRVGVGSGGKFRTEFAAPDARRCRLKAEFAGDTLHLPSAAKQAFPC